MANIDIELHTKLVYWLLGTLASAILGLSGLVISQQLTQSDRINSRLIQLEVGAAQTNRGFLETERRLQRIEDKIDKIKKF